MYLQNEAVSREWKCSVMKTKHKQTAKVKITLAFMLNRQDKGSFVFSLLPTNNYSPFCQISFFFFGHTRGIFGGGGCAWGSRSLLNNCSFFFGQNWITALFFLVKQWITAVGCNFLVITKVGPGQLWFYWVKIVGL